MQKGVFRLRADIVEQFTDLNLLYQQKLSLYNELAMNTESCSFHIISGNIDMIDEKLEESNEIITRIDALDYDITQIKSEICRVSGIEYYQFERYYLAEEKHEVTLVTGGLLAQMKKLMRQSIDNRDQMIKKLHEEQAKIASSIHSLTRTRALNTRFKIMHY